MIEPTPFIASVVPDETFDPERHVAFEDVFLEKIMSTLEEEVAAITQGAGLPDRGDQGWIILTGDDAVEAAFRLVERDPETVRSGTGLCGVSAREDTQVDLYFGEEQVCIGTSRTDLATVLLNLEEQEQRMRSTRVTIYDMSQAVGRIAVMGPDARKLLVALGIGENDLRNGGDHRLIEMVEEPVRICRSDFAGPEGYDFIIPLQVFNEALAIICAWGVRLGLRLLPVGWEARQQVAGRP